MSEILASQATIPSEATEAGASEREIVMTRLLEAPRELVFSAWTKPEHLIKWWGPNGFTNSFHEADIRPGGVWRFTMHGPDGTDYPNKIVYIDVIPPALISYQHSADDDSDERFFVRAEFEEEAGRTRLNFTIRFESKEARDAKVAFSAIEKGYETIAKLEAYLKTIE